MFGERLRDRTLIWEGMASAIDVAKAGLAGRSSSIGGRSYQLPEQSP